MGEEFFHDVSLLPSFLDNSTRGFQGMRDDRSHVTVRANMWLCLRWRGTGGI